MQNEAGNRTVISMYAIAKI